MNNHYENSILKYAITLNTDLEVRQMRANLYSFSADVLCYCGSSVHCHFTVDADPMVYPECFVLKALCPSCYEFQLLSRGVDLGFDPLRSNWMTCQFCCSGCVVSSSSDQLPYDYLCECMGGSSFNDLIFPARWFEIDVWYELRQEFPEAFN
jgi:hypothetical protein